MLQLGRRASFVDLRRQQQGGGLQDRQREGDAEEDSLYVPTMSACVFSARQRVRFQTVRGLVT